MTSWKSHRIIDMVIDMEEERYVLPVIQRPLLWSEDKMEMLFDTVLKGDPFGSIMVIEEEKDSKPVFNFRPFSSDGVLKAYKPAETLSQLHYLVIDGQQRMQTLYMGLKGNIHSKVLFFDLYSDYREEYEFRFARDIRQLPVHSRLQREISEHNWFPASTLLLKLKETNDEEQVAGEIIAARKISDYVKYVHVLKNIKAFYKSIITAENVGVARVTLNKSLGEAANQRRMLELFRRLNDGGTKLTPYDLMAPVANVRLSPDPKVIGVERERVLREVLEVYEEQNNQNLI